MKRVDVVVFLEQDLLPRLLLQGDRHKPLAA
jgi:hypothetical protein